ncbi:hypothetical protein PVIIG_06224 [Plasmodium vivax India VII]|uniref:Uncharacterized protein n=1 Tax=Plasmodium vivax India VII TaxID=1077284 RepID=A0A0J9S2N8_PLAVI|nr:hypothetical protein PVIIG_06224 [Plasmodium vivax India VII]
MKIAYDEFNKTVTEEDRIFDSTIMNNLKNIPYYDEKHKYIYEKIIRNLYFLLNKKYTRMGIQDYCRYLYQWIYHTKKSYGIDEYRLSIFYIASHENIVRNGGENICPYYSYDTTFEEPLKIIKLENMHYNIDVIENTLKSENDSINSCQKYVCECYKIYKEMYQSYCPYYLEEDKKRKSTCDKLREFAVSYMSYLFGKQGLKDKIPSLYDAESVSFSRCSTEEKVTQPREADVSTPVSANEPGQRPGEGIAPSSTRGAEQSDNSIPFNTSTIVSTVAGIPPFLALIYKVNNFYIEL